jgi:class 3 adenylate cyclase/tetratricopeptide (TPR) repeat protein
LEGVLAVCEQCGAENPSSSRFCGSCGAKLATQSAPRETRKVVTALFCDMSGSTALGEQLDPEVWRGVIQRYFAAMRATIERHGGTVEKFIGDAVVAVFGVPRVREDDALRAVRAASEIRERMSALTAEIGHELRFRTGINTGEVVIGDGEALATGDAMNVAARLEQAAGPGEILVGAETLRLVRDAVEVEPLEPLELKGKREPVAAFRLLRIDPLAPGMARHLDTTLVGRERELRLLRDAWERVALESGCHLFTLLGAAGVGKSRLSAELLADLGADTLVLRGRCLAYGEGITFWPLVEALHGGGERAESAIARLTTGSAAAPEELFWEVRRLLESLAAERALVLHVDDLQWAEPMLLDLLDHVSDLSRGAPILLLCTARPELLDIRAGWGGGKLNATTVLLEPLGAADSLALLEELGEGIDADTRGRVVAASQGNPLFIEEMAALARESGSVTVPATIQALLAARLEQLGVEEREVLERGAVEGEVFHRLALMALAGEPLAAQVDRRLAGLVRRELIRPHRSTLDGDDAFRFRHLLIRDAAYDALPKSTRAQLHERFGYWLEEHAAGLPELDEIAGWHFEQAVSYAAELGRDPDAVLRRRAAERLFAAGRRAAGRRDDAAARSLLDRALEHADRGAPLHAAIAVELAEQLLDRGEFDSARGLLDAAAEVPAFASHVGVVRIDWAIRAAPHEAAALFEQLPGLIADFERAGDERGLARAQIMWGHWHWLGSRAGPTAEHAGLAAEHARRAGDDGLLARALRFYALSIGYSELGVAEVRNVLEAIEHDMTGPVSQAWLDMARCDLACQEGRLADARSMGLAVLDTLTEVGMLVPAGGVHMGLGRIEIVAGDAQAARDWLLRGDAILAGVGERSYRSTVQASLALAEALLGDRAAALAASDFAEQLGAPEDVINFVITGQVRSMLARAAGDLDEAERLARCAIDHAERTDFYQHRGDARVELGRVLAAAGRREEAAAEVNAGLALYEKKGDTILMSNARALLAELC